MKHLIYILSILAFVSCNKCEVLPDDNGDILGKWELVYREYEGVELPMGDNTIYYEYSENHVIYINDFNGQSNVSDPMIYTYQDGVLLQYLPNGDLDYGAEITIVNDSMHMVNNYMELRFIK